MNHDEIEREEMLLGMSRRQLLVVMYRGPWPKAADETEREPVTVNPEATVDANAARETPGKPGK